MMRLLDIEFFKLRHTKYFWVLSILFSLMLLSIPYSAGKFVALINEGGEAIPGLQGLSLPFFDFVDIWQNLYWVIKFFSIFLGFIMVISVSNDISYGMMKQNIIDGLSRREYLHSKLSMIVALSLFFTAFSAVLILSVGYAHSPVTEMAFVLEHIEFVPAYLIHLIVFQLFCLAVALLIKRSGITIAFLLFYVYMIEPILAQLMLYNWGLGALAEFLPVNAINNVIRFPFYKYGLMETQTTVDLKDLVVLVLYGIGFYLLNRYLIVKRDVA